MAPSKELETQLAALQAAFEQQQAAFQQQQQQLDELAVLKEENAELRKEAQRDAVLQERAEEQALRAQEARVAAVPDVGEKRHYELGPEQKADLEFLPMQDGNAWPAGRKDPDVEPEVRDNACRYDLQGLRLPEDHKGLKLLVERQKNLAAQNEIPYVLAMLSYLSDVAMFMRGTVVSGAEQDWTVNDSVQLAWPVFRSLFNTINATLAIQRERYQALEAIWRAADPANEAFAAQFAFETEVKKVKCFYDRQLAVGKQLTASERRELEKQKTTQVAALQKQRAKAAAQAAGAKT